MAPEPFIKCLHVTCNVFTLVGIRVYSVRLVVIGGRYIGMVSCGQSAVFLITLEEPGHHVTTCEIRPCSYQGTTPPPQGEDPGAVIETACLESQRSLVHHPLWLSGFKE